MMQYLISSQSLYNVKERETELILETFKERHAEDAARLVLQKYETEAGVVDALPYFNGHDFICKMLLDMCHHEYGVAAFENSTLVGFMTCYAPISNYFGASTGLFSPIHAHATTVKDSAKIYSRLYQEASKKWVGENLLSHAIALYAHDSDAIGSFFHNGFGLRCVDAIKKLEKMDNIALEGYSYSECTASDYSAIADFENILTHYLRTAPMFMPRQADSDKQTIERAVLESGARFFIAKYKDAPIGFLRIDDTGENFICERQDMKNVCGAYLMPEHRSKGVFHNLLTNVCNLLTDEGYKRLGVDYESLNPTANAFWPKYFTPYTFSVTRRIDERIADMIKK